MAVVGNAEERWQDVKGRKEADGNAKEDGGSTREDREETTLIRAAGMGLMQGSDNTGPTQRLQYFSQFEQHEAILSEWYDRIRDDRATLDLLWKLSQEDYGAEFIARHPDEAAEQLKLLSQAALIAAGQVCCKRMMESGG